MKICRNFRLQKKKKKNFIFKKKKKKKFLFLKKKKQKKQKTQFCRKKLASDLKTPLL